jgi:GntR family transcriptional repressor for pyruvate dehydrogenase complex
MMVAEKLFRKFSRERLYEQIALHIEELISSGTLESGEKLPSERELAEGLGVGRGVVREAVKLLAERGLVTISPGLGTFIAEPDANVLVDQIGRFFNVGRYSYDDLREVRATLEVEIAGLAAQRAKSEDLERLKQAAEEMGKHVMLPEKYIEADVDFHLALARATQNEVFYLLIRVMIDLFGMYFGTKGMIFQVPGAPERGRGWHDLIYNAIKQGDARAAREAMRKHMQQVTEDTEAGEVSQSS